MSLRPQLNFVAPPQLPIVAGAVVPDPKRVGATAWSTIAKQTLVWDGAQWRAQGEPAQLAMPGFAEVTRTDGRVTSWVLWVSSAKTRKLREVLYTRDSSGRVSTVVKRQYDPSGALVLTLTSTLARDTDGRVASQTTVRT